MKYDIATAIDDGQRDYQEDAVVADFSLGNKFGFAVLADGMGGHAAGDIASKIVVTEVFSELKIQSGDAKAFERDIADILRNAALGANACLTAHVAENPELRGMGATLLATVVFEDRLYWISIGDSPLYLFGKGGLLKLNEDHSMAPQIDAMFKTGQLNATEARNHPDRNSLTSVVMGQKIPRIDCKGAPKLLARDDIVIAASDGIQFLSDTQIAAVLARTRSKQSVVIAQALLDEVLRQNDPEQDNISFSVLKVA